MKHLFAAAAIILIFSFAACTQQERARGWGGTATIDIERCRKIVNVTWKETQLWFVTRLAERGEVGDTLKFYEESPYNLMEGTVNLIEHVDATCFTSSNIMP